jgi:hypothetical protein
MFRPLELEHDSARVAEAALEEAIGGELTTAATIVESGEVKVKLAKTHGETAPDIPIDAATQGDGQ